MKISLGLFLFLCCFLICDRVEASPIQIGEAINMTFSGQTCGQCWGTDPLPLVTFNGLLTVVPVTGGKFWDPGYSYYHSNPTMITGLTGTMTIDCLGISGCMGSGTYSMSFVQPNPEGDGWSAPLGDGSWLSGDGPGYLVFSVDGSGFETRIIDDHTFSLFQWNSSQVPITFHATRVPEPSSLALLGIGAALIGILGSRQKHSDR